MRKRRVADWTGEEWKNIGEEPGTKCSAYTEGELH